MCIHLIKVASSESGYYAIEIGMSIRTTAVGFVPTQISGCSLWFDCTDSSTITLSSGSLTQWNDKSINKKNLTAVSGYANATVSSAFQNGLNVFNFSGNGLYRTPGGSSVYPQDCYIVVALKSTTAHVDVLGMGDTGSDNFNSLTFSEYSGSRWHNGSSGFSRTPNCVSSTTETSTSFLIMNWSIANGNFLLRRNGTQLVQTSSYNYSFGNSSTSIFQIGYRHPNTTAANFSGYIGEIVVFNSQLGTTQQQQMESYLAQKWGLTASLPGGHPGRSTIIYRVLRSNTITMTPFFTAFSPRQIPGCALWLDGADSSTITMVTGVSQWNDKSGNGYNLTQGSTGSQPTRTGNLLNFVTNYNMNIPQAAINNASTWSMFFAVNPIASVNWFMAKQRDGVNSYNIFSTTQTGGPGPNAYFTGLTNYLYVRMFNAGTLAASSAALTMSQLQILSFVYDGTNMLIYINGNLSSTTAGSFAIQNDTSSTNFLLGQWFGNGTNYNSNGNFQLGELIYFNSSLIATQRQRVESYLAQKWRLTSSLPAGHLHLTQPAGARTALSLVNSKMTLSRTVVAIPQTIAGLAMWLDATKITGFANGATLTSWTDTIGNRTFSNVNGVTYQTSIINGLPAVYMNGPGPYLEHSGTPPALVSGGTIYAVVQNNADGLVQPNYSGVTFQVLWQMNGYAHGWEGYPYNFNNTTQLGSLATGRRPWGYPFSTTYFKSPHIVKVVSITNNWTQSFIQTATSTNSSTTDTGTSTPTLIAPMRLGACMDGPGLGYYKGYFAEVLLYNRGLNSTEQTIIENYLKAKWNV